MFYLLLHCVLSLEITPIPISLSPPTVRRSLSAVYSPTDNSAYFFGGCKFSADTYSNIMWRFDLTLNTWNHLEIQTSLIPEPRYGTSMGIYKDLIYVFGGSTHLGPTAELWTYNITSDIWEEIKSLGDKPIALSMSGFHSFKWQGQNFFAIFGGNSMKSSGTNELYIMNFETQEWKKMIKQGEIPAERIGSGLVYYNEALYMWGASENDVSKEENQRLYKYSLIDEMWFVVDTYGIVPEIRTHYGIALIDNDIYVFLGIYHNSNIETSSTYKVNLLNGEWNKVIMSGEVITRNKFASVQNGKSVWIICGTDNKGLYNSIYKYDFSNNSITSIIKNTKMLKRRQGYSFDRINTSIVMFGGYDYDLLFGELYIWDLLTNSWSDRIPNSISPSPRYNHCSTVYQGLNLIIFGGEDLDGAFAEFYLYNYDRNNWSIITTDISVSTKTSCCMTTYKNFIIVHGGKTAQSSASDETLVLNMNTRTLRTLSSYSKKNINVNLMNHKCWIREKDNTPWLILSIGEKSDLSPSSGIYKANITDLDNQNSLYWTILKDTSKNLQVNWASSGIIIMGDWFIQIGGSKWVMYASSLINIIPLSETSSPLTISDKSNNIFWYKHGVEHFGQELIIGYSGATSGNLIKKEFITSHMYKIIPNDTEKQYFPCSTGTYGPDCLPCPLGTYSDIIGAEECNKCPSGTIGTYIAATSLYMCLPCPFGSFSEEKGAVRCKNCIAESYCPIGSTDNFGIKEIDTMIIVRPKAYSENIPDPFDGKIYYIVYFFSVALFLAYHFWPWLRKKLKRLDYFSERHSVKENQPLMKTKTAFGGFSSIIFVLFTTIYISELLNTYSNNNILETKSLVPSVTINENFKVSNFTIKIELFYYRGNCIDLSQKDKCSKDLYTDSSYIVWNRNCDKEMSTCIIKLKCSDCELPGNEDILNKICEFGSYASGIRVTVSSESSIPGYISSVSYYINQENGEAFRGTEPSVFYFEVTRSLFKSDSKDWPSINKGYHIALENTPIKGSSYDGKEYLIFRINLETCLEVKIKLDMANSILMTTRTFIYNFYLVVSAGIGSIFGFLELFVIAMLVYEKTENTIYMKIKAKRLLFKIIQKRVGVLLSFDNVKMNRKLAIKGIVIPEILNTSTFGPIPDTSIIDK
ncbi:hypothetical protein SteCoe_1792 [Stentor coeruleus]|uniref:Uncharacterized protein n=1 Tax=Stentor coeruleus TaxID=5963 RepID=A0A1R2D103_9CILI|nr:hypothetical protein SteCoe_1792 [Stentor coeruleus]